MSVIYYPAGEKHGIKNVGDTPARYLVFEFHAPRRELRTRARRFAGSIMRRALTGARAASDLRPRCGSGSDAADQFLDHRLHPPLRAR